MSEMRSGSPKEVSVEELKELVKLWIRSEYAFRIGDRAFTREAQGWLLTAERRLRRAATGKGTLDGAFREIEGC